MAVQAVNGSPTQAMGLPLTNTPRGRAITLLTCGLHRRAGNKCGDDLLPKNATGRPLTNTSGLPVTMEKPLQCGIPRSPILATAGMIFPCLTVVEISQPTDQFLDVVVDCEVPVVSRVETLLENQNPEVSFQHSQL